MPPPISRSVRGSCGFSIWQVLGLALFLRIILPVLGYYDTRDVTMFYTPDTETYVSPARELITHHRFLFLWLENPAWGVSTSRAGNLSNTGLPSAADSWSAVEPARARYDLAPDHAWLLNNVYGLSYGSIAIRVRESRYHRCDAVRDRAGFDHLYEQAWYRNSLCGSRHGLAVLSLKIFEGMPATGPAHFGHGPGRFGIRATARLLFAADCRYGTVSMGACGRPEK